MPPKKYNTRQNSDGEDSDASTDTVVDTPAMAATTTNVITMSEEQLSSIFANIARTQAEANKVLIESLVSNIHTYPASTPIRRTSCSDASGADAGAPAASASLYAHHAGSFAKCTARFSGAADEKNRAEILEAFLDAVETFKECTNVSDYHAMKGLPMLLTDDAAIWWQGVKATTATWAEAVAALRGMYGAPRPAYKIFKEIFSTEQCSERAEIIITRVRSLISKLPYGLSECVHLDIVYGLLHRRIRKRIPRDSVTSMDALILKARSVEEAIAEVEVSESFNKTGTKVSNLSNADSNSNVSLSKNSTACLNNSRTTVENNNSMSQRNSVRPRCSYCRLFGHSVAECRKAGTNHHSSTSSIVDNPNTSASSNNNSRAETKSDASTLRCYGCGQPGVIKSQCNNCKTSELQSTTDAHFNTLRIENVKISHAVGDVNTLHAEIINPLCAENSNMCAENTNTCVKITNMCVKNTNMFSVNPNTFRAENVNLSCAVDSAHPMVSVSILGRQGVATLDTGASHSLASPALYKILCTHGVKFLPSKCTITLADGTRREQDVLTARVDVTVMGRSAPIDFIILPELNPRTLLGRDFIISLGIVLDVPGGVWYFSDATECEYQFVHAYKLIQDKPIVLPTDSSSGYDLGAPLLQGEGTDERPAVYDSRLLVTSERYSSGYDLRAPLLQGEGTSERPIVYDSLLLVPAERNSSITEGEARARRNKYANEHRRPAPDYQVGDLVLLKTQGANDAGRGQTPKLIPCRDGPYRIRDVVGETTYILERIRDQGILGKYHVSVLTPFVGNLEVPIQEKRRRGRPRKS